MSLVSLNIRSRIELETRVLAAALKQSFERGDTDGVSLAHRQLFMLLKDAGKPIPEDASARIVVADSEQELASGGVVKLGAGPKAEPVSQISQAAPPQQQLAPTAPVTSAPADFSPGERAAVRAESGDVEPGRPDQAIDDGSTQPAEPPETGVSDAGESQIPTGTPQRDLKVTQDLSTALRNYQPSPKAKRDLVQEMRHFTETTAAREESVEPPETQEAGKSEQSKFKQGFMRHAARVQQAAARMAAKIKPPEPPAPAEPTEAAPAMAARDQSQVDTLRLRRQRDAVTADLTSEQAEALSESSSVSEATVDHSSAAQETPQSAAEELPGAQIELATETEFEIVSAESALGLEDLEETVAPAQSAASLAGVESGAAESASTDAASASADAGDFEPSGQSPAMAPHTVPSEIPAVSAPEATQTEAESGSAPDAVPAQAAMAAEPDAVPAQAAMAAEPDAVPAQAPMAAEPDATAADTVAVAPDAVPAQAAADTLPAEAMPPDLSDSEAEVQEAPPPRPNIYALLDVSPMSPFDEIHRRFMRKARLVLLAIKKNKALRHQKLAELQRLWIAHDILTDPVTRTDYDFRDLGVRGAPDSLAHPADDRQGRMAARTPLRIGELLQCAGLLEANELEIACDMHKAVPDLQFGTFLVRQGFIQERDLESALVGQKLLRVGAITVAQFQVAMDLAQSRGSLIDETLIEKGYITKDDLEHRLNPPSQESITPPVVQIREIPVNPRSGDAWKEQLDLSAETESGTPRQSLGGFLSSQQSAAESNRRQRNYHLDLSSSEPDESQNASQKPAMNYELDFSSPPPEDMLPSPPQSQADTGDSAAEQRKELRLSNAVPNWTDQIDWTASEGEGAAQEAQPEAAADSDKTVTTGDFSAAPVSSTGDFDVVPLEHAQALEAAQAQAAQKADQRPAIDVNNDMLTAITADGARFEMLTGRSSSPSSETQPIFLKQSEPGFDPGLTPALDAQQQQYWAQNDPGFDQHEGQPPADPDATDADLPESGFFSHLISATEIFESSALPLADADADSNGQPADDRADKESDELSSSAMTGDDSHGDDLLDDDAPNTESSQSKGVDRRKRRDSKRRRRR